MKVLVYSTKPFELPLLEQANNGRHQLQFTAERLTSENAMLALNYEAISIFSADDASEGVLKKLKDFGVNYITLRSAGHDNVNKLVARRLKMSIANVPVYSPHAIAEHALTLLMAYNRKVVRAQNQTLQYNFLLDHLIGFDLQHKTVGVMGTGKIGSVLVKILNGFDCKILANDTRTNEFLIQNFNIEYLSKDAITKEAEIIFICLPLTQQTHHLFDAAYLRKLTKKPIIVNVARGAIVQTEEILKALDEGMISGYATDVYEREHGVFFYDRSHHKPKDDTLRKLLCHPKTLVTPHQAFATREALQNIAATTIENLNCWEAGKHSVNEIS